MFLTRASSFPDCRTAVAPTGWPAGWWRDRRVGDGAAGGAGSGPI